MKVRSAIVAGAAVFGLAAALVLAAGPAAPPSGQFGLEIAFSKAPEPDAYRCSAKITDLQDGRVLAEPGVTARAGQPATTRSGVQTGAGSDELVLTFTVRSEREVEYRFTYLRDGKTVSAQAATVKL